MYGACMAMGVRVEQVGMHRCTIGWLCHHEQTLSFPPSQYIGCGDNHDMDNCAIRAKRVGLLPSLFDASRLTDS